MYCRSCCRLTGNEDACFFTCTLAVQMDVQAGVGYGIVVDGFAGKFGTYEITISSSKVLPAACATPSNVLQFLPACHFFLMGH